MRGGVWRLRVVGDYVDVVLGGDFGGEGELVEVEAGDDGGVFELFDCRGGVVGGAAVGMLGGRSRRLV